ncbi:MAG: glycosyltransferase family 39 protein [Myxococcaceae bacterium]|nr:glycosyltransferase family 39 protein [Myxococcaceae bacterium]MCI0672262.1 glycosyltransferase family 39 protein [Myxococcaceae bacterium]
MTSDTEQPKDEASTFTEAVLGRGLQKERWAQRFLSLPDGWRVAGVVALLGAVLFLPFLGAVGLWDPWETHYGEVARAMIARNDYVYPYWESAWFFSKTPFTMWLQALGMLVVGAMRGPAELGRYTEWGMRLPFALLSITALCLLAVALSRVVNRRVGLASAFALATMPLYFLLARQAVTDTPFVATLVCAMSCALIGQLDETTRHRSAWWYAFYVFCGAATLSKGLMGFALPAAIVGLYVLLARMPVDGEGLKAHVRWLLQPGFRREVREGRVPMPVLWEQFARMRLLTGLGVFLAVVGPWFLTLHLFDGVDDEGKLFWYRFWIHDHFNRLASGVHTTTPGGSFTYFIEQGGYAIFPWVAAIPGALALVARLRLRGGDRAEQVALIGLLWAVVSFLLVGASATKFHHYVFPVLPGLAILIGLFVDRLWEEGLAKHSVALLLGLVLFVLVGKDLAANPKAFPDLFVYNYERPYPTELVTRPLFSFLGQPVNVKSALGFAFALAGVLATVGALQRSKVAVFSSFWALAAGLALWLGWVHWVDLSHHWTQRDLFWRYYRQRQPDEPITAFYMNWRGETFYSRNTVKQIKDQAQMRQFAAQPGREWALVEHNRLNLLRSAVGPDKVITLIDRDLNNKFVLVTID